MSYLVGATSTYFINSKFRVNPNDDSAKFSFVIDLPDFNQYDRVCVLNAKMPHTYWESLDYAQNGKNIFILNYNGNEYIITVPQGNYTKQGIANVLESKIIKIIPNSTVTFPLNVEGRQKGRLKFKFHNPNNGSISMSFYNHKINADTITDEDLTTFNNSLILEGLPPITKEEYASRLTDVRSKYIMELMGFYEGTYTIPNISSPVPFLCNSLINLDLGEHLRKQLNDNKISFQRTLTTLTMVPPSSIPALIKIDNISLTTGQTILLSGMYDYHLNGVYDVTFVANTSFVLTRNVNYNTDNDFTKGDMIEIFTGYEHYGEYWQLQKTATLSTSKIYEKIEANVINSPKTPHTRIPSTLLLESDLVYGDKGDYTLQEIDVGHQGAEFDDIIFQQTDVLGNSKTLSSKNNKIFKFTVLNENKELIDFNGLDIQFTLLFYQQNPLALFQLEELRVSNIEKMNKLREKVARDLAKDEQKNQKQQKKQQEEFIQNQDEEHNTNLEKLQQQKVTS